MTFPPLDRTQLEPTRDALHAYAQLLGAWLKQCRPKRKHWWHASLRPSVHGLTTGVVDGPVAFELELDLTHSRLHGTTATGARLTAPLEGQNAAELSRVVARFLADAGVDPGQQPEPPETADFDYRADQAAIMGTALRAIAGALAELRASIAEETSPIQVWPHHFDLSMLWLPGEKIPGQDPADEEESDKQMNLGFVFGDAGIPDPYFYVTAYPTPAALADLDLPAGAGWRTEGFTGAVLMYETLLEQNAPRQHLLKLWTQLLNAGRNHMTKRLEP